MKISLFVALICFISVCKCFAQKEIKMLKCLGDSISYTKVLGDGDLLYNSFNDNGLQYIDSIKEGFIKPVFRIPVHIVTSSGTIIVVSEIKSSASTYRGVNFCVMCSRDNGKTFKKVLMCKGGYAGILYDKINEMIYVFKGLEYTKSVDDGVSWSTFQRMKLDYDNLKTDGYWTSICVSPNNGIQLKNGILVVPCILQRGVGKDITRNSNAIIYSKDFGQSWIFSPPTPANVIANEMTIAEYEDNQIMVNTRGGTEISWSRYNPGRRVFISNKKTLSDVDKWCIDSWKLHDSDTVLKELVCNASFIKIEYKGRSIGLFCNPQSNDGKRKNLTLQISSDFNTWYKFAVLTPLNKEVYGYCSMSYINGKLSFVYEDIQYGILYADLSYLLCDILLALYP